MITFLRQSLLNFRSTGAVVPSSRYLARALAAPIARSGRGRSPKQILEAGPGTGALTVEILRHLEPNDRLTLCEINACFVRHLEDRLLNDPLMSPWHGQVSIYHGPVEELDAPARFDHIISGLPFNNFPPELVRRIFDSFFTVGKPAATISFFEYVGIRKLKAPFVEARERDRIQEVEGIIAEIMSSGRRHLTLLNLPPAWACHVRNGREQAPASQKSTAVPD